MNLLLLSLRGGVFILAVALTRLLLQKLVPRRVYLLLWAVAVALLAVPLRISAVTSIYNLLPTQQKVDTVTMIDEAQPGTFDSFEEFEAGVTVEDVPAQNSTASERQIDWLFLAYLFVAGSLAVTILVLHLRNLRRFRRATPVTDCSLPLPGRVRLRTLDHLQAPLTYGILRPVILLPDTFDRNNETRLRHVLEHELSHIRNFDLLYKLIMLFSCVLHWFNPLCWLMFFLASQDMEMRCDADVLKRLGSSERLSYAKTLVATEEAQMGYLLGTGFSYSSTCGRLKQLSKKAPKPIVSALCSVLVCTLIPGVFATGSFHANFQQDTVNAPTEELVAISKAPETEPCPTEKTEVAVPIESVSTVPEDLETAPLLSETKEDTPSATVQMEQTAENGSGTQQDYQMLGFDDPYYERVTAETPRIILKVGESHTFHPPERYPSLSFSVTNGSVVTLNNDHSADPFGKNHSVKVTASNPGTSVLYYTCIGGLPHHWIIAVITVIPADSDVTETVAQVTEDVQASIGTHPLPEGDATAGTDSADDSSPFDLPTFESVTDEEDLNNSSETVVFP